MKKPKSNFYCDVYETREMSNCAKTAIDLFEESCLPNGKLSEMVLRMECECGMSPSEIYSRGDLGKSNYSQIISGKNTKPSRETLLRLSVGLMLNECEIELLFECVGYRFPFSLADTVVLAYVQEHGYDNRDIHGDLARINSILMELGQPILQSKTYKDRKTDEFDDVVCEL